MKNIEIELKKSFGKMLGGAGKVCNLIADAILRDREPPSKTALAKNKGAESDNCITGTADASELSNLFGDNKPVRTCRDGAMCLSGNLFVYQEPGGLRLRFKPYLDEGRYTVMWKRVSDGNYRIIGDVSEED